MNSRMRKIKNIDFKTRIKNHPIIVFISLLAIVLGTFFKIIDPIGYKIEKKEYVYNLEINNKISKLDYENVLLENNNLQISLDKYRSKNTDTIMTEIYILKEELKTKTDELLFHITSIFASSYENSISQNTDERYKILTQEIESIRKRLDILYDKL